MLAKTYCSILVLGVALAAAVSAESFIYNHYATTIPADPYDEMYGTFYKNLPSVLPCVATGNVYLSTSGIAVPDAFDQASGCYPAVGQVQYTLFPLSEADAKVIEPTWCGSSPSSSYTALSQYIPKNQGDITLVLAPTTNEQKSVATSHNYNLSCFLSLLPAMAQHIQGTNVRGLFFNNQSNFQRMGAPSPLSSFSPYSSPHSWNPSATNSMWKAYNATGLYFPATTTGAENFESVRQKAYYNKNRLGDYARSDSQLAPRLVSQSQFTMWMNQYPSKDGSSSHNRALSCLTNNDPFPTCFPIGGLSVWGTTQPSIPSQPLPLPSGYRRPSPGSKKNIAIMVSSTATSFIHDAVPAAGTAASITTLLLIVEAVKDQLAAFRSGAGANQRPQLYFFFFAAEDYGLAGSARFVKDIHNFDCERLPQQDDTNYMCMFPLKRNTNFTGVDLSSFEHFIHLDQIGTAGSDQLYQQVDLSLWSNTTGVQRGISREFELEGIGRSVVGQIAPGPLFTFFANSSRRSTQSFTTIAGYDNTYGNNAYQTPFDTSSVVPLSAITSAAQSTLNVLSKVLGIPAMTVNATMAPILWHCFGEDFGCAYFRDTFGFATVTGLAPVYYPSIFRNYEVIGISQQFIRFYMREQLWNMEHPVNDTCPCANYEFQRCIDGKCYDIYTWLHASFSPSLKQVDNAAPVYWTQDENYGPDLPGGGEIWVESTWDNNLGARTATMDSTVHGVGVLLSGLLSLVLTALAVLGVQKVVAPKLKDAAQ